MCNISCADLYDGINLPLQQQISVCGKCPLFEEILKKRQNKNNLFVS